MRRSNRTWVKHLSWVLLALVPAVASAQARGTVIGTVLDATTQRPIVGAQVVIPELNRGTLTNTEGRYTIPNLPPGTYEIRAVSIGYERGTQTVTVSAGESEAANFALATAAVALDAVVVTATGEQRAREIANAIGTVDAAEVVEKAPVTNITETLQGRTPGVTVLQSSGTTGTGAWVRIRGNASISLDNTPLIVVDGVRVDNDNATGPGVGGQDASRLNDFNPDDIERIEIIKGPAAATLYGTEAAAGVVQIFTKKGRPGEPRWTFRTTMGANVNDAEFPDSYWNPQSFFGTAVPDTVYTMNLLEEFDPFREGAIRTFAANVRGGGDNYTYYISGEREFEEGTLPNNEFDRWYARGNFSVQPTDNLDVVVSSGYTTNRLMLPDNDNNGFGYIGVALIGFPWDHTIERSDLATGGEAIETCPLGFEIHRAFGIPLGPSTDNFCSPGPGFFANRSFEDVQTLENQQNIDRFTGSVQTTWTPRQFWTNRLTIGYDQVASRSGQLVPVDPEEPFGDLSLGYRFVSNNTVRNFTLDAGSSFNFDLTPTINSVTSVGAQFYREVSETAASEGRVFPRGATTVSSAVITQGFETFLENRTLGLYIQEQLGWRDRFFLTGAVRADDNSAFGQEFDLVVYPKLQASYVISEEDWFPRPEFGGLELFNQLKLRAAYGESGKQPDLFASLNRFDPIRVSLQNEDLAGAAPLNLGNPFLEPEVSRGIELGFDAGLFDNRLGMEFTYYDQKTRNAIVLVDLRPSIGFPDPVFRNIAELSNSGVELGLDALLVERENVAWNLALNLATNDNEVGELENPIIFGLGGSSQRHAEGFPFGSYFAPEIVIGPDGEPMFAEVDTTFIELAGGEQEMVLTPVEVFQGQPTPEWEGSVHSTLTLFGNLSLYALVDFKGGHQLFNSTEEFRCGFLGGGTPTDPSEGGGLCPAIFETGPGDTYTQEAKIKQFAALNGAETPWIEDADFAKLRSVSIRWTLPEMWTRRFGGSDASITLMGQNLATWTDYTGMDPEINYAGQDNATRAEFLTLPVNKRFVAQFQISF